MKYFFVLGNHPELSMAELDSRLEITAGTFIEPDILIADCKKTLDSQEFIGTIGGTIKMGRIVAELPAVSHPCYLAGLDELLGAEKSGKFNFGISVYGKAPIETNKFGLSYKQALKDKNVSCRFVTSRDRTLSSVVVEQNKLVKSGRELVFVAYGKKIFLGVTEAVQPFKELSARDYGRPSRDDRSGMLPPKLAQILINLSGALKNEVLLDPFCGSGTIITEALGMGYQHIIGSDIAKKAIDDSVKNVGWVAKRYRLDVKPILQLMDARELSRHIKKESIGAIATETYLGPQHGAINIEKVSKELTVLYNAVLREVEIVLKKGGRAAIAFPAFMANHQAHYLTLNSGKLKRKEHFLYGRQGQRVWRDIVIFEKK